MKSVLMSIKPKYCELIAAGKKTIEVRKTKPKIETPFKCYIYQPKTVYVSKNKSNEFLKPIQDKRFGKIIGEFVCDEILCFPYVEGEEAGEYVYNIPTVIGEQTCLDYGDVSNYGNGKSLYLWHISDLIIYDKPKELSEFVVIDKDMLKECTYRIRAYNNPDYTNGALLKGTYVCNNSFEPDFCRGQCGIATKPLTRPPQSWCYVVEGR